MSGQAGSLVADLIASRGTEPTCRARFVLGGKGDDLPTRQAAAWIETVSG
jgi:hypothetical protein